MGRALELRLAEAEGLVGQSEYELHVIEVSGGLEPGIAKRASFDGFHLEGNPEESLEDFCSRARAAAVAAKAKFLVLGGLPPPAPLEWNEPPGQRDALAAYGGHVIDEMDSD